MLKKLLLFLGIGAVLLLVLGLGSCFFLSHTKPQGKSGPKADEIARKMQKAVNIAAWRKTGAVQWRFVKNEHIWDRRRSFSQVSWGKGADRVRVQFPLAAPQGGLAWRGGQVLAGKAKAKALKKGFAAWCNDSFWLNPIGKVFDKGVTRKYVDTPKWRGVLVSFSSGGVTPGDTYMFVLDEQGLVTRWHMWVKVIPIGGIAATFEQWRTLKTGAKLSTQHKMGPATIKVTELKGARTLQKLLGKDIFAPLQASLQQAPKTKASSRPVPRREEKARKVD